VALRPRPDVAHVVIGAALLYGLLVGLVVALVG
jgi:hypothetical protein